MSSSLLVSTQRPNFDSFLSIARSRGTGLEIQSFTSPEVLDNNWKSLVKTYAKRLKDFEGGISLHGAFYDAFPNTRDKRLKRIVRDRYMRCLEIGKRLGARAVVFHAHFNPFIKHSTYIDSWVERQVDFWKELVDFAEREQVTITLENLWEESPSVIQSLLRAVPSERFKACFDTGHANLFSRVPIEQWVKELGKDLFHVHLHNNHGEMDEHLSPRNGTLKFEKFFKALEALPHTPQISIEVQEEKAAEEGVEMVRALSPKPDYAAARSGSAD